MKAQTQRCEGRDFADGMGFDIAYQGLLVTALVMVSYFIGHFMETGEWTITNSAHGITMAFVTMSMAEIFHSMNMRSQREEVFSSLARKTGFCLEQQRFPACNHCSV